MPQLFLPELFFGDFHNFITKLLHCHFVDSRGQKGRGRKAGGSLGATAQARGCRPEAGNRRKGREKAQPTKTYQRYMIDQLERMISD